MNKLLAYLARPDVSQAPVRLLARRARMEALRRWMPATLAHPRTFRLSDGALMTAPLSDSVGGALFAFGGFEPDLTARLRKLLQRNELFIDVGAHIGTFSVLAGRIGAEVVAFEPTSANRALLIDNININDLRHRVLVNPTALLDRDAELTIGTPDDRNSGMARLGGGTEEVQCRRLDDVLPELTASPVRVMKIDVEGFEADVLRGGERTICRDRPHVLFEVNDFAPVNLLREWGYRVTSLDGSHEVMQEGDLVGLDRPGVSLNLWAQPN